MKNPIIKRIIVIVLVLAIMVGAIFFIRSCSAPPEYSEIEARFKELIAKSQEVNVILYGDGLEVYERIYEPKLEIFKDDANEKHYYYVIEDEKLGSVYVYEGKVGEINKQPKKYLVATDEQREGEEIAYEDTKNGLYYYYTEYEEPKVEFYYTSVDPTNFSYVRDDAKCISIAQIKAKVDKVYSQSYLRGLYETLFDGFEAVPPRYMENGTNGRLMQNDNFESLFSENCVYMFETAEIDTWASNSSLVRIKIKAYLPSAPDKKYDVTVDLAREDGQWYLETPTYLATEE